MPSTNKKFCFFPLWISLNSSCLIVQSRTSKYKDEQQWWKWTSLILAFSNKMIQLFMHNASYEVFLHTFIRKYFFIIINRKFLSIPSLLSFLFFFLNQKQRLFSPPIDSLKQWIISKDFLTLDQPCIIGIKSRWSWCSYYPTVRFSLPTFSLEFFHLSS